MSTSILTYRDFQQTSRFQGLDGIRALAIIGTVFAHAPNLELWNFLDGQFGVIAFFVLSGFLITTLLLREERDDGEMHYLAFLTRRAFRLFPAYYAILLIYFLMIRFNIKADAPENYPEHFFYLSFYLQEFFPVKFYYQTWSLGIEEKFYFFLPLLSFKLLKNSQFRWLITYGIFICLACVLDRLTGSFVQRPFYLSYGALVWGSFLAVLMNTESTFNTIIPQFQRFAVPLLIAFIVLFPFHNEFKNVQMISMILCGILIVTIVAGGLPKVTKILENRLLVSMGQYSYFMYLVHLLVKNFALKLSRDSGHVMWDSFVVVILTLVMSYFAAMVSFKYFESPLIHFGHRLSDRFKQLPTG